MKKFPALTLTLVMVLSLAACVRAIAGEKLDGFIDSDPMIMDESNARVRLNFLQG